MAINTAINTANTNDLILKAIESEVKRVVALKYDEMKDNFLKQIEKDKASALCGISLWMMKQINIRDLNQEVIITLRKE